MSLQELLTYPKEFEGREKVQSIDGSCLVLVSWPRLQAQELQAQSLHSAQGAAQHLRPPATVHAGTLLECKQMKAPYSFQTNRQLRHSYQPQCITGVLYSLSFCTSAHVATSSSVYADDRKLAHSDPQVLLLLLLLLLLLAPDAAPAELPASSLHKAGPGSLVAFSFSSSALLAGSCFEPTRHRSNDPI